MSEAELQTHNLTLEQFFEQLTWSTLEKRIRVALKNPKEAVPLEIHCPAVMDLARQILGGIADSAIKRRGEPSTEVEVFNYDQRLAVLRILEAIISEYEEWKLKHLNSGTEVMSVRFRKFENRLEDLKDKT
jgi:hypothetical protein